MTLPDPHNFGDPEIATELYQLQLLFEALTRLSERTQVAVMRSWLVLERSRRLLAQVNLRRDFVHPAMQPPPSQAA